MGSGLKCETAGAPVTRFARPLTAAALGIGILGACSTHADSPRDMTASVPTPVPATTSDASTVVTGNACGVACTTDTDCVAPLACLPAAAGGSECKPESCRGCAAGTFCAFDTQSCTALGCTTEACGYPFVGACDACAQANCCSDLLGCKADAACASLATCFLACPTQDCVDACWNKGTADTPLFDATASCMKYNCAAACSGGAMPPSAPTDAGPGADATPDAGPPLTCDPPCLAGQTCGKLSALSDPSCLGDQCQHVTCPNSLNCSGELGNYAVGSGCTANDPGRIVEFGAVCGASITGHDPVEEQCHTSSPNTMHCDFPEGSIDCPALWEYTSSSSPETYTAGCCGAQATMLGVPPAPYCGIPGLDGSQPNCAPLTPGNGWAAAP
jgi:hypothetical protein